MNYFRKIVVIFLIVTIFISSNCIASAGQQESVKNIAILEQIRVLRGGTTGEGYIYTMVRAQIAIVFLRLNGLEQTARTYDLSYAKNFKDANDVKGDAVNMLAYLKEHPELGWEGTGNNKFNANAKATVRQYYKILLIALGYKINEDFTWANTLEFAKSIGLTNAYGDEINFYKLADITVEALRAKMKDGSKTLIESLVEQGKIYAEDAKEAKLID